jgi:hypothetical protein
VKCRVVLILGLSLMSIFGCSNSDETSFGSNDSGARSLNLPENNVDVSIIEVDSNDAEVDVDAGCCGVPCHCGEEYEYQIRCWKTQTFFCTPDGQPPGDDPSLYQQHIVLDTCNENGEPCTPSGISDDECQWEVVDIGECEDWLECDPTAESLVQEDVPCTDIDEDGNEFNGLQDFLCQKGKVLSGPCRPCGEEVCDGVDNDCDNIIDEGMYPCESECGPGLSICVDGELTLCDAPLPFSEICDGLDNDCDNEIDEELIQECQTDCEVGVEFCVNGNWSGCTAKVPEEETCNGFDDNCNGLIDEGLQCSCPPEMIGFLIPCMEDPLVCGQGFKVCECSNEECSETEMSQCLAICHWLPAPEGDCDPLGGMPTPEVCNNFDDDCDQDIDEDLFSECYTGPEETLNVGVCLPGNIVCSEGKWGSFFEDMFVEDMCLGEVLPIEEDLCTGQDDNCDGNIEKVLEETDILFIVDISGSMSSTINAVQTAMSMFSAHYADQEVVQWGLVVGPVDEVFGLESLVMVTNLVPFNQFLPALASIEDNSSGDEMLYDAIMLSLRNLIPAGSPLIIPNYVWADPAEITSSPQIGAWNVSWREDANHVIIVFSDEAGQSYLQPEVDQNIIQNTAGVIENISIYTFSEMSHQHGADGWGPIAVNGSWHKLTANPNDMFDSLMEIIEETACGGE